MDCKQLLYNQLALDFSTTAEALQGSKNIFTLKAFRSGRRLYRNDDCILQILSINGIAVMSSTDSAFLSWCRDNFSDSNGTWISEFDNLRLIDEKLHQIGHRIEYEHPFFIPGRERTIADPNVNICWYEQDEINIFRGDKRFHEAVSFDPDRPDVLAVAAVENEETIGLAGASADSPAVWQIGIDVLPYAQRRGIASYLTWLLKDEILRRGFLPFYGTGASHIQSQKVAINAGFVPAWWELYTVRNN